MAAARTCLSLLLALATTAAAPTAASAATRYVGVGGSTTDAACDIDHPCEIQHALTVAQQPGSTDEILVAAGDYELGAGGLQIFEAVTLRGAPGARPRLIQASGTAVDVGGEGPGAVVEDLEIRAGGADATAVRASQSTLDRVVAVATGPNGIALSLRDGAVARSSVAWATATGGQAVLVSSAANGAALRGVTAIGADAALTVDATAGFARADVVGTILRGGTDDIRTLGTPSSQPAVAIDHSAFRPGAVSPATGNGVTDGGGNIAAEPLFAEAATGDFHQLADSPTIDAGRADPAAAATDLDGDGRALGPAPDIGADERPPPEPTPTPTPAATPQPTPTSSPAPSASPTPEPTQPLPLDLTLPTLVSATFTTPPVAGKPANLVVHARDFDSPILGVIVDLGPAGLIAETACRTFDATGVFAPGADVTLTIPVVFPLPGAQVFAVEVLSGGCSGLPQTIHPEMTVVVAPAAATTARASVARASTSLVTSPRARASASCAGTLAPTARSEAALAEAVVCLINRTRKAHRLRELTVNPKLVASATAQTMDMIARRYYGHQRPGGPNLKRRVRKAKYSGRAGENLGLGSGGLARPAGVLGMWLKSPPHRANILRPGFRSIGVFVRATDPLKRMRGAAIYTVNFGTRP